MDDNKKVIEELKEKTQEIINKDKPKNLYQKLLTIQKTIKGLGKDKKSFQFSYVTGNKILDVVKPLMNEVGVILKQEVISVEKERVDYKTKKGDKSEMLFHVKQKFTWVDCDTGQTDVNEFFASGMNDWEKGLGSALTYAERYFLLKYFHIATDEDDIDNPDRKQETQASPKIEKTAKEKGITYITKNAEFDWIEKHLKVLEVKTLNELNESQIKTLATSLNKELSKK